MEFFISTMENKRYHIIIASTVFAILMWVSINMGYEYTVIKRIPVVLENRREDRAFRYPIPKFVTVRFQGHGWQLAGLYFLPELRYLIDLASLNNEQFVLTARDFTEHVKIPFSIQPLDIKPDSMVLAFEESHEKKVRVLPRVIVSTPDGYGMVGAVRATPESVLISGTQSTIDAIAVWHTEHRRYENQRTPVDEILALDDPMNYALDASPRSVRVQVDIEPFAEKTFEGVSIIVLGAPVNREVVFIPPRMDVAVRGSIDELARLTSDNFQAKTEFQSLLDDSTGTVVPSLACPEGVKVIRRTPEKFQFIIRKKL